MLTAKEKGFFDEVGITVEMVEFADGPTIIAAMESGSIDIGYIGQGAHKLCINGQASIFALSHIVLRRFGRQKSSLFFRKFQRRYSVEFPDFCRNDNG